MTNKPRFSLSIDNDLLGRITDFQKKAHYSRRNDAISALIEVGLESYNNDKNSVNFVEAKKRLDGLRYDSHTRALLNASQDMTAKEIDQMTAFAEFLRSKSK